MAPIPPMASRPYPICNDWKRGFCPRGPNCRFTHPMTITEAVISEEQKRGYSLHPPSHASTKLVIDRIPVESCTIAAVHEHFSRFGTIVNIDLMPELGRARIQFATAEEAKAAHESPEVIFNNRFVKVFWDTDQPSPVARPAVARRMDPQEELLKKRKETLDAFVGLQKQKEALLLKYTEQQMQLMERLSNANLDGTGKAALLEELKVVQAAIDSMKPPAPKQSPILRGGPVRRAPQAYATYKPYAPAVPKNPQAYKLDLRPKTIRMEPIPAKLGTDPAGIRKFFEPFGQVANLVVEPGSHATVTFLNRHDAEKAMATLSSAEDEAKFSWVNQQQPQQ